MELASAVPATYSGFTRLQQKRGANWRETMGRESPGTGQNTNRNSENNEQVSQHEAPRNSIVTVLLCMRQHWRLYLVFVVWVIQRPYGGVPKAISETRS